MEILPVTDGTGPWLWSTSRTQVSQYPVQPCDSMHLSEILCHHLWLRITVNPPVLSQEPWRRTSLFYTSHLKTLVLWNTGRHKSFSGFPTARGHSNKTAMQQQEGNVYWVPSSYQTSEWVNLTFDCISGSPQTDQSLNINPKKGHRP